VEQKQQFDGKTLNDALEKAASKFGVAREQLDYKVVKESQGGFFGLLGGKVVIEAWAKKAAMTDLDYEKKYGIDLPEKKAPADAVSAPRPAASQASSDPRPQAEQGPQGEGHGGHGRRRRRRGHRGPGRDEGTPRQQVEARPVQQERPAERQPRPAPAERDTSYEPVRPVSNEQVTVGPEIDLFLKGMFAHIGETPEVVIEEDSQQASVRITVRSDSIFSSREGHTIESLKTLLDKAINKGPVIRKKVRVQVSEAVSPEQAELVRIGRELGKKAKEMGRPISVRGLSPQDRKVIHTALVNDSALETLSSGDGLFRKLYIVPRGAKPEPERKPVIQDDEPALEEGGSKGGRS
jgi:spoIIIJ-associated protein